jgi:translation initiation factor IF-2
MVKKVSVEKIKEKKKRGLKTKATVKIRTAKVSILRKRGKLKPAIKSTVKIAKPRAVKITPSPKLKKVVVKKEEVIKKPQGAVSTLISKPRQETKVPLQEVIPPKIIPQPERIIPKPEIKKEIKAVREVEKVIEEIKAPKVVAPAPVAKPELRDLELRLPITVKDLAVKLQEKPSVIIKMLMDTKVMVGINQILEESVVSSICEKFGFRIKKALDEEELALRIHQEVDSPEFLKPRSPIVTLMGHVDHGKTSLLDAIRKTRLVDSEHGGITQHIGAYRVSLEHGEITFLDTPGHEAFTAMRARGASITDIVILVVAADDGVMPQTKEAIDHARAAGVSIIVAINKIDKPQANIDRVKKQLSELNLTPEDWSGKTITQPVSAKTGEGVNELLEMILLEAQMLELKANPNRLAQGIVIEAKLSKGKGPLVTLLVKNGTLHLNDNILVGSNYGKIRAMFDDRGQSQTAAGPSFPVEVLGISGVPVAGEQFFVIADEGVARKLALKRQEEQRQLKIKTVKRISLEELHSQIKEGKIKELKLIIKVDVQGSLEAIKDTLSKIETQEIKMDFIHEGVGNINYSDVILAVASNALILGFNVVTDERAKELAQQEGIEIKTYNLIYELANEIKAALEGMLEPRLKKIFIGSAQVRKVFKLSKAGTVAGCFVVKGKIIRSNSVSLIRNGQVIFEGDIANLKRFKDDVREVSEGFECGIALSGFSDLQEGDIIEAYGIEKIARRL